MLKESIEFIFGSALFINAILFIPQAVNIIKTKSTKGISLTTFFGFLLIQIAVVLHGIIKNDYLLSVGYLLSIVTCGMVVGLIFYYRKSSSCSLEGEELSFEEVFEQMPGHIYWKNKHGILLYCNPKTLKFFGLKSLAEYRGKTDYDLLSKEEADRLSQNDQEVMRTGMPKIVEEHATMPDGTTKLYLSHKMPLRGSCGNVLGILGVSLDITEERKKDTQQHEMLENIIAMMPGHVYWVNKEGIYLGCNDNQAKSAGLMSRQDIVGKQNKDLPWNFTTDVLPKDLDYINEQVMSIGTKITLEEPAILDDGTELTFLSSKVPLRNRELEIIGMVGISIDITNLKKVERALILEKEASEAANKAKSEFLHNMRHDLRTPFSGILGIAELMEHSEQDAKKRENLGYITQSARVLLDQLEQMFEFVHIESGELSILEKRFDLHNTVIDLFKMMLPSAKNKGLNLNIIKDDNLPQYVIGDQARVQRILINLLANSIKFTKSGHIKLIVNLLQKKNDKLIIKFIVEDTGIGIPEDKRDIIFEQFNRLSPAYKGTYPGKGLGLRMVKQFLDEIKGQVTVESSLGKGTIFKVKVPFKIPFVDELDECPG